MLPGRLPLVLSVPLSVGVHTTSQLATLPLATLQEREMELAVMELTLTNTCPGAGTAIKKMIVKKNSLMFQPHLG